MKINLDTINRDDFEVPTCEISPIGATIATKVVLIKPFKTKLKWSPDEYHLRSLLCLEDGTIVSSGFPKFMNFGENAELDRITKAALERRDVLFTNKEDGSLIIRSVINGHVHFRTRGSDELGIFEDAVMTEAKKYPKLFDPTLHSNGSILCEFTSPEFPIIVKYKEPKLTFLAFVDHTSNAEGVPVVRANQVIQEIFTSTYSLPRATFHDLPHDVTALTNTVKNWNNQEGVVAWCEDVSRRNGTHLAKFKSFWYLMLHALKAQLSGRKLKQFCFLKNITTEDELRNAFGELGFDWEALNFVTDHFREYISHRQSVLDKFKGYDIKINAALNAENERLNVTNGELKDFGLDRKIIALTLKRLSEENNEPDLFPYGIALKTGKIDQAQDIRNSRIMEMGVNEFRSFLKSAPKNATDILMAGSKVDDG